MSERKTISARQVVADIKAGMIDADLMRKYTLSASGLQSLFDKLLKANLISAQQLASRPSGSLPAEEAPRDELDSGAARSTESQQDFRSTNAISKAPVQMASPSSHGMGLFGRLKESLQEGLDSAKKALEDAAKGLPCSQCGQFMGLLGEATTKLPADYRQEGVHLCWDCAGKIQLTCAECSTVYNITRDQTSCPECERRNKSCQVCGTLLGWGDNVAIRLPDGHTPKYERLCRDCLAKIDVICPKCGTLYRITGITPSERFCPECRRRSDAARSDKTEQITEEGKETEASIMSISNDAKQTLLDSLMMGDDKYGKAFREGKLSWFSMMGGNWNEYAEVVLSLAIADTLLSIDRKLDKLLEALSQSSSGQK